MDDGHVSYLVEYDRAELAEQKLAIAVEALRQARRRYPATEPMVMLALKRIKEHTQRV